MNYNFRKTANSQYLFMNESMPDKMNGTAKQFIIHKLLALNVQIKVINLECSNLLLAALRFSHKKPH